MTPLGYEIGLVPKEQYEAVLEKYRAVDAEITRLSKQFVSPSEELDALLVSRETAPLKSGVSLADLLRRPQLTYDLLAPFDPSRPELSSDICEQVGVSLKYEGYIKRQEAQIEQFHRMESLLIPEDINYESLQMLRIEARQKLQKIRPRSIGQASRISGVSPADITALLLYLGV